MPGEDLLLDESGDYVDDGAGGFEMTTTAISAVRHQMLDRLGEWIGDTAAGRTHRGIAGRNNTQAEVIAEADSMRKALEELERDGLITDIRIETDLDARGRWGLLITCRDAGTGEAIDVNTLGEFGG